MELSSSSSKEDFYLYREGVGMPLNGTPKQMKHSQVKNISLSNSRKLSLIKIPRMASIPPRGLLGDDVGGLV